MYFFDEDMMYRIFNDKHAEKENNEANNKRVNENVTEQISDRKIINSCE